MRSAFAMSVIKIFFWNGSFLSLPGFVQWEHALSKINEGTDIHEILCEVDETSDTKQRGVFE